MKNALATLFATLLFTLVSLNVQAADGTWSTGTGNWTNNANWVDGVVAGAGDSAMFIGPTGQNTITVPRGYPFILSSLIFNPTDVVSAWYIQGETNTLVAPARLELNKETVFMRCGINGSDGLHFYSKGECNLALEATNIFSGKVIAESGRLLPRFDRSLGVIPASYIADAVVLSNSVLGNYSTPGVEIHANRGITVVNNGYFHGREVGGFMRINSPITGDGNVWLLRQSSFNEFCNPDNDYSGDTIFGGTKLGYYNGVNGKAMLCLGANEVIPHGVGKGKLLYYQGMDGVLDLQGHSETVNSISAPNDGDLSLINSSENPGTLKAGYDNDAMQFNIAIGATATLEKIGSGTLRLTDNSAAAGEHGRVLLTDGTLEFTDPAFIGYPTLALNGAALTQSASQPGLAEYRGTVTGGINPNAKLAFNGIRSSAVAGKRGYIGFPVNTQFCYRGQWYVPVAGTYSFAKSFDDGALLKIDNAQIINNSVYTNLVVVRDVAIASGWHDIEIWFYNGTGGVGPYSGHNLPAGLVFDPTNSALDTPELQAAAFGFAQGAAGTELRTTPLTAQDQTTFLARTEILRDTTLTRNSSAELAWCGDLLSVLQDDNSQTLLTVTGQATAPLRIGAPDKHTLFGADVADANGILFQERVWVLNLPQSSAWNIKPGADFALGATDIFSGNQTLSDYSLRIPSSAPLGIGDETITVQGNANAVIFDATRERDKVLLSDPDYNFEAANTVVLDGTDSKVIFDGAGTVNFTGTISGDGNLVKVGKGVATLESDNTFSGQVTINDGVLAITSDSQLGTAENSVTIAGGALELGYSGTFNHSEIRGDGGALDVPQGALINLTGNTSGTLKKGGAGALSIDNGNELLDLYVANGSAILNTPGKPAVRNIVGVDSGAKVKITADDGNQIDGSVKLTGGALDLAGKSESIGYLTSDNIGSMVTNSSATLCNLTVGENNSSGTYAGGLAGYISLTKIGTGWLSTVADLAKPCAIKTINVNADQLSAGLGHKHIRFLPKRTRVPGKLPNISEFQITLRGKVIPWPAGTTITGTTSTGSHQTKLTIDNDTRTSWQAGAADNQYITIKLPDSIAFDGYRWFTGATTAGSKDGDPVAWEVQVSADNITYWLVDARDVANNSIKTERGALAGQWQFTQGPMAAAGSEKATIAASAILRVHCPEHAINVIEGAGELDLRSGTQLTVSDLSDFTGLIRSGKDAKLALLQDTPLAFDSVMSAGLTVFNAGEEPLSAVIGNGGESAFLGTLTDGTKAPLGVIKRGNSELRLANAGSGYSGDTVIESGALSVSAGKFNFRYVRFNVTAAQDDGKDGYGFEMAYSEFQLLNNGTRVAWPLGTTVSALDPLPSNGDNVPSKAIDNNVNTRWLSGPLQALTIDTKTGILFDGYQYYTSKGESDWGRSPKSWLVEGSDDGVDWVTLDVKINVSVPAYPGGSGMPIGPFTMSLSTLPLLPAELQAETPATNRFISGITATYLRFNVTQIRYFLTGGTYQDGFQFAELQLLRNGAVVPWPEGVTAYAPGGQWPTLENCNPSKVVNNTATPGDNNDRWISDSFINPLYITLPVPVTFDAYQWVTTHNAESRDPIGWTLEATHNTNTWYLIDERQSEMGTTKRLATVGPFPLQLPNNDQALDTIPDNSRMVIQANGALRIGMDTLETVGPLSGNGTLEMDEGARLTLNLFESAEFAGSINAHNATLALANSHAQSFTGESTIAGNLTVDFCGGRFGGLLRMTGTLTVTGFAAYAMPPNLPARVPLFEFAAIDATSRAILIDGVDSLDVPEGYEVKVRVTNNAATLSITRPGLLLLLK